MTTRVQCDRCKQVVELKQRTVTASVIVRVDRYESATWQNDVSTVDVDLCFRCAREMALAYQTVPLDAVVQS